jgi:hypothetical protein
MFGDTPGHRRSTKRSRKPALSVVEGDLRLLFWHSALPVTPIDTNAQFADEL